MTNKPHWFGPKGKTSKGAGHPLMFGNDAAQDFGPFPDGGGYPIRFLRFAYEKMGVTDPARVLHLCSGSMLSGVRVDVRHEMRPDVIADCTAAPFADESFDWIMADPPYSEEYAANLYGTAAHYPKPGVIAREACRLLRPGGAFGLLHFQVPMIRKPMQIERVYGITTGMGYAIRAWTLCRKGSSCRTQRQLPIRR